MTGLPDLELQILLELIHLPDVGQTQLVHLLPGRSCQLLLLLQPAGQLLPLPLLHVQASLQLFLVVDHLVVGGLAGVHLLLQALQLLYINYKRQKLYRTIVTERPSRICNISASLAV